jgi:hypothetical protein
MRIAATAPETIDRPNASETALLAQGVLVPGDMKGDLVILSGGVKWTSTDGEYKIDANGLTAPPNQAPAPLREVVYVVDKAPGPQPAYVAFVFLVFKSVAGSLQTFAVKLQPRTFMRLKFYGYATGVKISTVAMTSAVHDAVPVIAEESTYPSIALSFQSAAGELLPESAIAASVPQIVVGVEGGVLHYRYENPPTKIFGRPVTPIVRAGSGQRSITMAGLRDASLNGVYEAADTTPPEWKLLSATRTNAKIVVGSKGALGVLFLTVTNENGTQTTPVAMRVTDGGTQKLAISSPLEALATAKFGNSAYSDCAGSWENWAWARCTAKGDEACATIARCAAPVSSSTTGQTTFTLVHSEPGGSSIGPIELRPVQGPSGSSGPIPAALYGKIGEVVYVLKFGETETTVQTASVIRQSAGGLDLYAAKLSGGRWVIGGTVAAPLQTPPLQTVVVPADCAELRACLRRTPLDLSTCAAEAQACNVTSRLLAGANLDHAGRSVELYTLDAALFGADDRGVFVVSVSEDDAKRGKCLFVATGNAAPSVVDVEKENATWREVKGISWILIGGLIGGGVVLVIVLAVVAYLLSQTSKPTVDAPRM